MSALAREGSNDPHGELPAPDCDVDDEASICRALLRLLRVSNYQAEAFGSPLLFLESLAERVPDCVVLDLQMPAMTGVELQQRLLLLPTPARDHRHGA